jgi:hypothetical protein
MHITERNPPVEPAIGSALASVSPVVFLSSLAAPKPLSVPANACPSALRPVRIAVGPLGDDSRRPRFGDAMPLGRRGGRTTGF